MPEASAASRTSSGGAAYRKGGPKETPAKREAAEKAAVGGTVKRRDVLIFTKKLTTLLESGLPIMRILRMLETQSENPALAAAVNKIYKDVESGASLSEAFGKHENAFDSVYVNLMRAGEAGGRLTVFMRKLIVQIEKSEKIRAKVKKALMYPIILLCVACSTIIIMMVKVVPVFANMFSQMGADLPAPTQALVNMSDFCRDPARGGALLAGLFIAGWMAKMHHKRSAAFRKSCDGKMLQLPVLGNIVRNSVLAKIAMMHGNLSAAGVPVMESLEIIRNTMTNSLYTEALKAAREGVSIGTPLSELLEIRPKLFPATFCQMLNVGEETGNVDEMLNSAALYYEEEFDLSVDRMTELLEPIMIVGMGGAVGFIIVAMYMPIFQMGKMASAG